MKNLKYLTIAIALNASAISFASANETTEMGLSLATTIDALLQQNLEDLQPLNSIEASKLLLGSNAAKKEPQKFIVEIEETSSVNNTAKLTE
ncbi:hypothetical protein Q4567_09535 [Aliiglaciecola sp. 2_MG-2023]|uniref:hypothetical protein n=1 Tax=unclassified Aliiglaciecola TaxID=2593648 RepID=UPI0026E4243B|nr:MULTISPECIES: hypothetical protein [unclassified Aliiglaciecola]MDO6710961.1 hypothetical protein [Aliiglaciecola sp. 2_MG-2023]MDO6752442.1 hypothetical protein [Aliiglaciecola sp. 1_MG-2023]